MAPRTKPGLPRRRGPLGARSDADLLTAIRAVIEASPFLGEGYRKVWARLRFQGIRTAARRVRRLMKEHGLLAPHRPAPRLAHPHDGTIVTERVDEVWGTDMTETVTTAEGRAYVFIAVDHCSGELVGTHASSSASRWEALEPIRQGVARHFGGLEADRALGLILRHDHGSNYMAEDFQREIRFLGITSSPVLRASARGQRRGRARHPDAQGAAPLGPTLRHGRGPAPGLGRIRHPLQRHLAASAARTQDTRSDPGRTTRPCNRSRHGAQVGGVTGATRCLMTVPQYSTQLR